MYYALTMDYFADPCEIGWFTDIGDLVNTSTDVNFFPNRDSAIAHGKKYMDFVRKRCESKNIKFKFEYQETDEPTDDYYWSRMTVLDSSRSELGGLYAFAEFRVEEVNLEE